MGDNNDAFALFAAKYLGGQGLMDGPRVYDMHQAFDAGLRKGLELAAEAGRKGARCSFHDCVYCQDGASASIRALGQGDGGRT